MRPPSSFTQVYLYREAVDMRKQINGLASLVEGTMKLNPFSEALFVFLNRKRDTVKVLYWDRTGFALWHKRLEKERFMRVKYFTDKNVPLTSQQLAWFLEGYDLFKMRPHQELSYKSTG